MQVQEDIKIKTKIRFITSNKKQVKVIYTLTATGFTLEAITKKCKEYLKRECEFTIYCEDGATKLQDQLNVQEIVANLKKGKVPVFICKEHDNGEGQIINDSSNSKKQLDIAAIDEQKTPQANLKREQSMKKDESKKVVQEDNLKRDDDKLKRLVVDVDISNQKNVNKSLSSSQKQVEVSVNKSDMISIDGSKKQTTKQKIAVIREQPEAHIEKMQKLIQESVGSIMQVIGRNKYRAQTELQLAQLLKSFIEKSEVRNKIEKNISCYECKRKIERGPVYECLICPQHLYFCSECEQKEELSSHTYRAHTLAKIKYNTQFIKQKQVSTYDWTDISEPGSEPQNQIVFKKSSPKAQQKKKPQYQKQRPIKQQSNHFSTLSALQIQKKRCALKSLLNYTNAEVEFYMQGEYASMSFKQIVKQIET